MKCMWMSVGVVMVVAVAALAEDLVVPGAKLEKIATGYGLADGPAYDGKGNLYFPDVKAGHIYRYSEADGKVHMFKENFGKVSAMYFMPDGNLAAVDNGRSRIVAFVGDDVKVLAEEPPPAAPNDMSIDATGGVYYTMSKAGEVHYGAGGKVTTAATGVKGANGIILAPDGKTLYVGGHSERSIWAFPVLSPGKLGEGKIIATLGPGPGSGSDGMTVDSHGNIYGTGQGGVYIVSPEGKLLAKIDVEDKPLVNATFGGKDMKTLYIVAGGSVFRIQMNVAGVKQVK